MRLICRAMQDKTQAIFSARFSEMYEAVCNGVPFGSSKKATCDASSVSPTSQCGSLRSSTRPIKHQVNAPARHFNEPR